MGGKKPIRKCLTRTEHKPHVWRSEVQSPQPGAVRHEEKLWCPGVNATTEDHVHQWDKGVRIMEPTQPSVPRTGPFTCTCGMSRWLFNGVVKRELAERFPHADAYDRILALRAKLARGKEEWNAADQAEFEAIGEALVAAFKPLVEAMQKMGEQVVEYMQAFFDRIDPAMLAQLAELAKAHGEKPDEVNTVCIVGLDGKVERELLITPPPVAAVNAMALQPDDEYVEPEPEWDVWDDRTTPLSEQHFYEPGDQYPRQGNDRINPATGLNRQNIPDTNLGYLGSVPVDQAVAALQKMGEEREAWRNI